MKISDHPILHFEEKSCVSGLMQMKIGRNILDHCDLCQYISFHMKKVNCRCQGEKGGCKATAVSGILYLSGLGKCIFIREISWNFLSVAAMASPYTHPSTLVWYTPLLGTLSLSLLTFKTFIQHYSSMVKLKKKIKIDLS